MSAAAPQVFTIAPTTAFVDALAAGLIDRTGGDRLALARAQVLLPSRRAVRALTEAFVRRAEGGLLLPRLTPLGDIEPDDALDIVAGMAAAPLPAIDPVRRRLLLARLIRRWRAEIGSVEALRLADQLGAAFDTLARAGVDPARLADVSRAELATHWQKTFDFFEIVLQHWPAILAEAGCSDRARRGNQLLEAIAAHWAAAPPPGLVVAAGMNGATPAQARLLATIARLPQGMVVLPGLDTAMSAAAWDAIIIDATPEAPLRNSEEHPQYGLKRLLDDIGVARAEVQDWPAAAGAASPPARAAAVARALCPPAFTAEWRAAPLPPDSMAGVTLVEAPDAATEAQVIALALREALETPGMTAALVTPDRALARRVAAHCARWGVALDDSAGQALTATPPGALALALAEAAAQAFAPVALLAVLKHPLVRADDARARLDWLDHVRQLDLDLRGVRPAAGLAGIAAQIDDMAANARRWRRDIGGWWGEVTALLTPLAEAFARPGQTLAALVAALSATLGALAGDAVWRGADGRALAERIAALTDHGEDYADLDPADLPALLAVLLGDVAVRPVVGRHPRLAIWGLIEARLQRPDLVILGGLSEGVWPAAPAPDPWLAPAVRRQLGLPGLEAAIGQAAHDFTTGLGAPRVLLTRARRDDSGPRVPSRFWLRLRALAGGALAPDAARVALARALDAAGTPRPAARPAPAPPPAMRPRKLSVTAAEKLRADPFSFYADRMLRLEALELIDADPSGAERGTAVHKILENWMRYGRTSAAMDRAFAEQMAHWTHHPLMMALWAPRVRRALDWVLETCAQWDDEGWTPIAAEARGELVFALGARGASAVTLTGVADRIDRNRHDKSLAIIDYKTGTPPSHAQVVGGFALQMGLLGALAEKGVLAGVPAGAVARFSYWKLSGGTTAGVASDPLSHNRKEVMTAADHISATVGQFVDLCEQMLIGNAPFTAKLHPEYAEKYQDFDHLARVAEWLGKPGGPA